MTTTPSTRESGTVEAIAEAIIRQHDIDWETFTGLTEFPADTWAPPLNDLRAAIASALTAERGQVIETCIEVVKLSTRNIEAFENDVLYPVMLGRNDACREIIDGLRALAKPSSPEGGA